MTGGNCEPLRMRLDEEPWGKRRSTDGNIEIARLGLTEHSMDVAAVFEALAALPSIRDRLARLAGGELTETVIARLAVLAFLHDIGKASVGFQSKALPAEYSVRGRWLADARIEWIQCGHTRVVAGLLFNAEMKRKRHGDGDRARFSRERAREALRRMRIDVEDARVDLRRRTPAFGDVFRPPHSGPFAATPLQQAMEDRTLGSVVIAESETGSGKTEAALWRFKTLFEAGEVDALAFLLPTRVAAISLEGRVRRFFEQLFPDPDLRPNVVLAVPGYIQSDGERGSRQADGAGLLSRFETLWPDTAAESAAPPCFGP